MKSDHMLLPGISHASFLDELEQLISDMRVAPFREKITASAQDQDPRSASDAEVQPQIGRVIVYIEQHLTEQLSLEKLAEEAQLSKYQLIRLFRKERDITPWKFLITKRIDKVKELLEEGASPGQAAVEAGFYDQSHLNKTFREETGQTPREYQEKNFKNRN